MRALIHTLRRYLAERRERRETARVHAWWRQQSREMAVQAGE